MAQMSVGALAAGAIDATATVAPAAEAATVPAESLAVTHAHEMTMWLRATAAGDFCAGAMRHIHRLEAQLPEAQQAASDSAAESKQVIAFF